MVHELHLMGFQRLRACPYLYATGSWRCAVTPRSNALRTHGAIAAAQSELTAVHSSAMEEAYFDWPDGPGKPARTLARMFVERLPKAAAAGYGPDWEYAGWFAWMLHQTHPYGLPYAFSDWEEPQDYLPVFGEETLRISLPPPGEAEEGAAAD